MNLGHFLLRKWGGYLVNLDHLLPREGVKVQYLTFSCLVLHYGARHDSRCPLNLISVARDAREGGDLLLNGTVFLVGSSTNLCVT